MLTMFPRSLSFVVVVAAVGGCDDATTRAPVTIVVDTDGARAREDTQRLREVQKGVQDDRVQLERARSDLAAARKSLETAASPAQKVALSAEVQELEARLAKGSVVVDVVTRTELDTQLRAQEERLKAFISSELQAPSAAGSSPRTKGPAGPARALVAEGKRRLQSLEVEAADVPGALVVLGQAEQALVHGDDAGAEAPARAFAELADGVIIDRAFVRQKYERVSAALKNRPLSAGKRDQAEDLLKSATRLSATDAPGANRALNQVLLVAH